MDIEDALCRAHLVSVELTLALTEKLRLQPDLQCLTTATEKKSILNGIIDFIWPTKFRWYTAPVRRTHFNAAEESLYFRTCGATIALPIRGKSKTYGGNYPYQAESLLNDRLFAYNEGDLYEVNVDTNELKLIHECKIAPMWSHGNPLVVLHASSPPSDVLPQLELVYAADHEGLQQLMYASNGCVTPTQIPLWTISDDLTGDTFSPHRFAFSPTTIYICQKNTILAFNKSTFGTRILFAEAPNTYYHTELPLAITYHTETQSLVVVTIYGIHIFRDDVAVDFRYKEYTQGEQRLFITPSRKMYLYVRGSAVMMYLGKL